MSTAITIPSVLFPNSIDEIGEVINHFIFLLQRERMGLSLCAEHRQRWHRLFLNLSKITVPGTPPALRELRFEGSPHHCRRLEEELESLLPRLIMLRSRAGLYEYVLPLQVAAVWRERFDALGNEEKSFFLSLALPLARLEGFQPWSR